MMKKKILLILFFTLFMISYANAQVDVFNSGTENISVQQSSSVIGEFYPSDEIQIESQDYIDRYFEWTFTKIDDKNWIATFKIDSYFLTDIKTCQKTVDKNRCFQTLCDNYLTISISGSIIDCKDNKTITKISADLTNLNKYPLVNLTSNIKFSNFIIDLDKGIGSFNIIFPEGFKAGEKASLGFGTTIINTGTTTPFNSYQRAICRDGKNYIHVVWFYNSTNIRYANSTDNGATFTVNNSFYGGTSTSTSWKYTPSISCDGNSITVAYEDTTADDVIIGISTDNGATWAWQNPRTSDVFQYISVERRGQNIYVVYTTATATYYDVVFFNSSDGGSTWGANTQLWNGQNFGGGIDAKYYYPALAVNGTGSSTDDLYVAVYEIDQEPGYSYYGMMFKNSADSGKTWSAERTIYPISTTTVYQPSLTLSNSAVFLTTVYVGTISTVFYNVTTDKGASWTGQQISVGTNKSFNPTITLNNTNPFILWENGTMAGTTVNDIFYRNFNGNTWDSVVAYTTDQNGNNYPNAKKDFSGNCIEFVYMNGTVSPYNITYVNMSVCTAPTVGAIDPPAVEVQQSVNITSYNTTYVSYVLSVWVFNHLGYNTDVNVTPDSNWGNSYIISLPNNQTNITTFSKIFSRGSSDTNQTITAPSINASGWQQPNSILIMIPVSSQPCLSNLTAIAEAVWTYQTRTLTDYNQSDILNRLHDYNQSLSNQINTGFDNTNLLINDLNNSMNNWGNHFDDWFSNIEIKLDNIQDDINNIQSTLYNMTIGNLNVTAIVNEHSIAIETLRIFCYYGAIDIWGGGICRSIPEEM